ncbi:MAG: C39 family peptidase, partial [Candidatus Woesearchaeota archaeon]
MKKKATEYSVFLMIIIIIVIFTIIVRLYTKYNSFDEVIGTTSYQIMNTYEKAEKFNFYIENSIKQNFYDNLFNNFENAFNIDCKDEYFGYKLINTKSCKISLNNIKMIDIKKTFYFLNATYPGYDFYFISNEDSNNKEQKLIIYAKTKNKLVTELMKPITGKCCALSTGLTTTYIMIEQGDCNSLNTGLNFNSAYNYFEVDRNFCGDNTDLDLKLESDILKDKTQLYAQTSTENNKFSEIKSTDNTKTDKNNYCSYCGSNKQLVKKYFSESSVECDVNICCNLPCPPGNKKLNLPFYAQCDFGIVACSAACGPTTLKMALDGFHNRNYDLFKLWIGVSSIGSYTNPVRIVEHANKYDSINSYCTKDISFDSLKNYINQGSPVILLVYMPLYNSETA